MVTVAAKYVCGKLVVQRVFVAVVAKVANLICHYLVTDVDCGGCKCCKVSILTFGDRKGLAYSGLKGHVCMLEISCTKGVGCSGYKNFKFNMPLFSNK